MSKKLLLVIICLALIQSAYSQVRHVKGIKSLEGGAGVSRYGAMAYLGYISYLGPKFNMKFNGYYEFGTSKSFKYSSMGIDVSGAYTVFTLGESFYFNLRGGLTGSVDKLTTPITLYDTNGQQHQEDYSTLKIGAFGGPEIETFLSNKIVMILGWNERVLTSKDFGQYRWYGYVGIRYNLN